MKVVLPANEVPDGETVTKVTGEKLYTLRTQVHIWPAPGAPPDSKQTLKAPPGTVFLVGPTGDINTFSGEICWRTTPQALLEYLTRLEDARMSHD